MDGVIELEAEKVVEKVEQKPVDTTGWSPEEIEMGKKQGLIPKEPKKEETKKEELATKEEVKKEEPKVEKQGEPEAKKRIDGIPELEDLTPEQQQTFLAIFGEGSSPRGLYFRGKNERRQRQSAQAEAQAYKRELEDLKKQLQAKGKDVLQLEEEGEGEDRPLTERTLKAIKQREAEELEANQQKHQERITILKGVIKEQEEVAKSMYKDFNESMKLADDLVKNLDTLELNGKQRAKIGVLLREMHQLANAADTIDADDRNASDVAYELGQLHPQYGKVKPNGTGLPKDPKGDGALTPEKVKRVVENAQRRASSASVGSGNAKRTVVADEVTIEILNGMSAVKRREFSKAYPEQYSRLMQG